MNRDLNHTRFKTSVQIVLGTSRIGQYVEVYRNEVNPPVLDRLLKSMTVSSRDRLARLMQAGTIEIMPDTVEFLIEPNWSAEYDRYVKKQKAFKRGYFHFKQWSEYQAKKARRS